MKSMEELYAQEPNTECNEIVKRILTAKITELNHAILNYQKIVALMETMLPMVESASTYQINEGRIDEFIDQIFNDIQNEEQFSQNTSIIKMKGV